MHQLNKWLKVIFLISNLFQNLKMMITGASWNIWVVIVIATIDVVITMTNYWNFSIGFLHLPIVNAAFSSGISDYWGPFKNYSRDIKNLETRPKLKMKTSHKNEKPFYY